MVRYGFVDIKLLIIRHIREIVHDIYIEKEIILFYLLLSNLYL